jgi:hypothetical protein
MPDTAWPALRVSARLIPGLVQNPGFDANFQLRHVISGSLTLAFPTPT